MTDSKVEQTNKILNLLQENKCQFCVSWDYQGHFCYAGTAKHCNLAKQIDALYADWKSPEDIKAMCDSCEDNLIAGFKSISGG
jgi:hypothetical protein